MQNVKLTKDYIKSAFVRKHCRCCQLWIVALHNPLRCFVDDFRFAFFEINWMKCSPCWELLGMLI